MIDLHTHTDHDTIDGLQDASNYAENKEIIFIPGIELDPKKYF